MILRDRESLYFICLSCDIHPHTLPPPRTFPPFPRNLGPPISPEVFILTSICTFELTWMGSSTREDNFGNSKTFHPFHRCSSSDNSTTEWWLGNNRSRLKKIYYIVTSFKVAEHSLGSL